MNSITNFFLDNITIALFIYGLAFFTMGIAIFLRVDKGSGFKIADNLWWLAVFGILQGFVYWTHLFIFTQEPFWSIKAISTLKVVNSQLNAISFICLFQFGISLLISANDKKKRFPLWIIPLILFLFSFLPFIISKLSILNIKNLWIFNKVYSSYFFCLPGGMLAAYAFFRQVSKFKNFGLKYITHSIVNIGICFLIYSILSGLIVPKMKYFPASWINQSTFLAMGGIPVQVFQSICAIFIAISMLRILDIFNMEKKIEKENLINELQKSNNELHALYNITSVIIEEKNVNYLIETIIKESNLLIKPERATLFFLEGEGLTSKLAQGLDMYLKLKIGEGIAGYVAKTGKIYFSNDPYSDPLFNPEFDKKTGYKTENIMGVPIIFNNKVIGVIEVMNKKGGFSKEDGVTLMKIAVRTGKLIHKLKPALAP